MSEPRIKIEIVEGDVLTFSADVLVLKYAQHYYGSDAAVSERLVKKKVAAEDKLQPPPGKWVWVEPGRAMPSRRVLFVGVPPLIQFGYNEIAEWAKQAMAIAARDYPEAEHIAITLHGPGFGLDEIEALHAELRGVVGAVDSSDAPAALRRVSIVERKPARVERLKAALNELTSRPSAFGFYAEALVNPHFGERLGQTLETTSGAPKKSGVRRAPLPPKRVPPRAEDGISAETTAGEVEDAERVEQKLRAFVAMPFSDEMGDVFYYGIQSPVRQLGYICERVDQEAFTGDILEQVKMRIENAAIIIADLTGANPNVYLEVGYAWGKGRPTILIANKKDDLKFDVRGQRCLKYQSIKDLEKLLTTELKSLASNRKG